MGKKFIKLTAAYVLTAIVLYAGGMQQQSASALPNTSAVYEPVQQQAERWVNKLAAQQPFAAWKQAELSIAPIGPGTHSWLVLVKHQEKTVGYLIVHATETGGYQLGEYGTSSTPPFDQATLSRSIKQLELLQTPDREEELYVSPLLAAWKITAGNETYYTDSTSGEGLPIQDDDWLKALSANSVNQKPLLVSEHENLIKHVSLASFQAYDKLPWLTDKPLAIDAKSYSSLFTRINKKEQLRYSAELFDGQMRYVWSVVGYNKWDSGRIYVALETSEDGSDRRYIPAPLLIKLGSFYR
ncbi:hypothetical protein [Paenibacillus sinopodophylli]|uniref:hypothetical protein n=1 Tax=Paenibacillus sinopodophylli TaxID=1837342 RepID=UPI00110D0DDC|nr:hypothetical protein [Paenibacillus sinopodophylli]